VFHQLGANIICEVAGYGLSADANHATAPEPTGSGARRSMLAALRNSGLTPNDINYINAHATSTPLGNSIRSL
jgi:3-oxoacyl-[acyl-carrier-protein] synthase II